MMSGFYIGHNSETPPSCPRKKLQMLGISLKRHEHRNQALVFFENRPRKRGSVCEVWIQRFLHLVWALSILSSKVQLIDFSQMRSDLQSPKTRERISEFHLEQFFKGSQQYIGSKDFVWSIFNIYNSFDTKKILHFEWSPPWHHIETYLSQIVTFFVLKSGEDEKERLILMKSRDPLLLVPSPGSGSSSDHCDLSGQTDSNWLSLCLIQKNFRRPGVSRRLGVSTRLGAWELRFERYKTIWLS